VGQTEEDGRMFPVTDSSTTIVDCLMNETHRLGGLLSFLQSTFFYFMVKSVPKPQTLQKRKALNFPDESGFLYLIQRLDKVVDKQCSLHHQRWNIVPELFCWLNLDLSSKCLKFWLRVKLL
jgi:hypothetical protein